MGDEPPAASYPPAVVSDRVAVVDGSSLRSVGGSRNRGLGFSWTTETILFVGSYYRALYIRRSPHPVIVTIRDNNKDYIRVLFYSYYTTITGWGALLTYIEYTGNLPQKDGKFGSCR